MFLGIFIDNVWALTGLTISDVTDPKPSTSIVATFPDITLKYCDFCLFYMSQIWKNTLIFSDITATWKNRGDDPEVLMP